jgi:hypothetical protein
VCIAKYLGGEMRMKKFTRLTLIAIIAAIGSISLCGLKGDAWEETVRTVLYKVINDSVPVYSTEYTDERGIPYVYYYQLNGITAGKKYNPTIVCNYAIDYYKKMEPGKHSSNTEKFFYCTSWLSDNLTYSDNKAFYRFNWQQPWYDSVGAPYTSGMTSGLAIQVFTDAYRLTRSSGYLLNAKALIRGFFIPVKDGGFTYTADDGWWYEELADTAMHTPHILDGHIFAITGVYEYWLETKDDSAAIIISKGVQALKSRLKEFDIGNGWAYYDAYKKPADKKYQHILANQMLQLYKITGDKFFKEYYLKWNAPLSKPYIIRIIKERNRSGIILCLGLAIIIFLGIYFIEYACFKLLKR